MRSSSSRALKKKKSFQRQLLFREKKKTNQKKRKTENIQEGLKWNDDIPRLPPGDWTGFTPNHALLFKNNAKINREEEKYHVYIINDTYRISLRSIAGIASY